MRTICPKVSFVNLFVIAVIVDLSGWIYIVDVMCLKLAANISLHEYIPPFIDKTSPVI